MCKGWCRTVTFRGRRCILVGDVGGWVLLLCELYDVLYVMGINDESHFAWQVTLVLRALQKRTTRSGAGVVASTE